MQTKRAEQSPFCLESIFLVLSHMFEYLEQKLLGQSRKSSIFLKSNFFGSEKFQVSAQNFVVFSCTFAVIQILDNIGSTVYFLGDFNETFRLLFFHAHLWMCQVSLKKIPK
jgi:hypothetical protein